MYTEDKMKDIVISELTLAGDQEDYKGFTFNLPPQDNDYFHMKEQLLAYMLGLIE